MACNYHIFENPDCSHCITKGMWERASETEEIRKNAKKQDEYKEDPWTDPRKNMGG